MRAMQWAIGISALLSTATIQAAIPHQVRQFDIAVGDAAAAIQAFAAQSGIQVLASANGLAGRHLNAVNGDLPIEQALQQLLAGSGLSYLYINDNAVALVEATSRMPSRASPTQSRVAESGNAAFAMEEVIVTARRREENLQDTPVSLAAFTGAGLAERQVFNTVDLDQITPNLQFASIAPLSGNNSAAQVFIRGIGQTDATAGVDPGVGLYVDDVYMGSAVGGAMDFRDIAEVQVLRGPQGTLFGRNTIGGALLISTIDPGNKFDGTVKVGTGSDNLREAFIAVDVPLGEPLNSRWTFGMRARDGYVHRRSDGIDLGDVNNYSVTGKLLWTPNDALKLLLKGDYTVAREHGTPLVFAAINESSKFPRTVSFAAGCPGMTTVADPVPLIDDPRCANDYWNDGPFIANGTLPLKSDLENSGVAVTANLQITDVLSLKSITSYRRLNWAGNRDADNTPFPILHTEYRSNGNQLSQELQSLVKSDAVDGVFGVFYFRQYTDDHLNVTLASESSHDSNDNQWNNSNWAAFTQWTWRVWRQLSATAGVRYTEETKRSRPFQFNYNNPTLLYLPHRWFEKNFDATTESASIQYRWNAALMTYASWSQGFKSGGFNSRFNAVVPSGEPPAFNEETAEAREIGLKFDVASMLRLNMALFSTSYNDLQFTYRIGVAPFLFNAGAASISGAELEFQYLPTNQWRIEGGTGFLHAKIDKVADIVGATTAVTTRSKLPYAPELTGNVAVAYRSTWNGVAVTPRVQASYTGKQYFDAGNTVDIAQNDNVMVYNASAMMQGSSERWALTLGVNNVSDKIYPLAGNSSLTTGSGYAEVAYNRGREWVMNFNAAF